MPKPLTSKSEVRAYPPEIGKVFRGNPQKMVNIRIDFELKIDGFIIARDRRLLR